MITYLNSNLFFSPAKVLVNAVNTQGVMGKGIAKEYKKHFPEMFKQYRSYCEQSKFKVGMLWLYKTPNKWVLNFPTKISWRKKSELSYIENGLQKFADTYLERGIDSIAFPPLGCGNGELSWENEIKPLMEKILGPLPIDIYIHLYTPATAGDVPEHEHISNISAWLRSEPESLSFNEVILNLKQCMLLDTDNFSRKFEFNDEESKIVVKGESAPVEWAYDDLLEAWIILRDFGVLSNKKAPHVFADSYKHLINLFSQLPYVSMISSSNKPSDLQDEESISLQLIPDSDTSEPQQLAL